MASVQKDSCFFMQASLWLITEGLCDIVHSAQRLALIYTLNHDDTNQYGACLSMITARLPPLLALCINHSFLHEHVALMHLLSPHWISPEQQTQTAQTSSCFHITGWSLGGRRGSGVLRQHLQMFNRLRFPPAASTFLFSLTWTPQTNNVTFERNIITESKASRFQKLLIQLI